jgi:hypothetical protein
VVFVVGAETRVARRPVKLGSYHRDGVEVAEGLAQGEVVVTRGHSGLVDGALVKIAEQAEPPAPVPPQATGLASAREPAGASL